MKSILGFIFIPFLTSCFLTPSAKNEEFESAPSTIDERLESASIEDYVIALPPFAYHEGSVEQFEEQVRLARRREAENRGKGWDYLFVNGDGCWPSKDFVLNRRSRTLRVRIYNWEPGTTDYTETIRRVPGGWMRGPQVKIETAEQAETRNPYQPPCPHALP